ncbi:MAG: hypothetical protein HZB29_11945 [Nitrospinae bacterium]|nr:hypothetical protein [Nitrospinota bacterium]
MRIIALLTAALAAMFTPAFAEKGGVISVPAEASVDVPDGNYAQARMRCLDAAMRSAARIAVEAVVPPEEAARHKDAIEKKVISRGQDFVMSFKILEESTDNAARKISVRIQAAVSSKGILRVLGIGVASAAKKPEAPSLLVIVEEKNAAYVVGGNFLALNSEAEEVLAANLRRKGFTVFSRKNVREAGMDNVTLAAMRGEPESVKAISGHFHTGTFVFGSTETAVKPAANGEIASVSARLSVSGALNGKEPFTIAKSGAGVYDDANEGIRAMIGSIMETAAKDIEAALAPQPSVKAAPAPADAAPKVAP